MRDELFATPRPADFDEFWRVYPKRDAKEDAIKAWIQITAGKVKANPVDILAGARRYAEYCQGIERKFIKLPATWLRGRCWTDESLTPRPRSVGDAHRKIQEAFNAKYRWEKGPNGMRRVPL